MDITLLLPFLIAALTGVGALALLAGLNSMRPTEPQIRARMSNFLASGQNTPMTSLDLELSEPFVKRVIMPMLRRTVGVVARFFPQNRVQAIHRRLLSAGRPGGLSANDFVGIKLWCLVLIGGAVGLVGYLGGYPRTIQALLMWLMLSAIAFMLPDIWLSRQVRRRQEEIVRSLPDTLDMLVVGIEAGLSFENALLEITNKWHHALAQELGQVQRDIGIGLARRQALSDLADRVGVTDLSQFVSALNQADELGISIAKVLLVQAEEMRLKRRQRAQEAANKAPIKMLFPMVFLIFPALFAVLLGPGVPSLFRALGGL